MGPGVRTLNIHFGEAVAIVRLQVMKHSYLPCRKTGLGLVEKEQIRLFPVFKNNQFSNGVDTVFHLLLSYVLPSNGLDVIVDLKRN